MTIFELNILGITISPSYYWLMYGLSFIVWYYILKSRWNGIPPLFTSLQGTSFAKGGNNKESVNLLEDIFLYIFLWIILWWRLWYVFFYNFSTYIFDPLAIFKIWEWGMSFHWGVLWVIIAMFLFSKKYKVDFLKLSDQITLVLPIWLWLGRIWNYINGELLWYSWYTWLFAVYKDWIWYFPSPLLEAVLEWLVLYFILLYYYNKSYIRIPPLSTTLQGTPFNKGRKIRRIEKWQIASLFLIYYSLFRIFVEAFFRTPDSHIWYILWYFTMWELLSLPMLIIWIILYFRFRK